MLTVFYLSERPGYSPIPLPQPPHIHTQHTQTPPLCDVARQADASGHMRKEFVVSIEHASPLAPSNYNGVKFLKSSIPVQSNCL